MSTNGTMSPSDGLFGITTDGVTPPTRMPLLTEIGTSGTPVFSGYVDDEILPLLRGDRGRLVYREMADNSAIVGSFLFGIEQMIRGTSFEWEPADGDKSTEYSDLLNSMMHDMNMSWADTLSGIMSHLTYGWSFHEIVYKRRLGPDQTDGAKRSKFDDGLVGWRKWALRNQETRLRWQVDPADGGVVGMWQLAPPRYVTTFIPVERALLFRTTAARGNPEGRSLLRNAVESFEYMKFWTRMEGIGGERDLAGYPVIEVPSEWFNENSTDDQKAAVSMFEKYVTGVRRDALEGVVMPTAYDEHGNKIIDFKLLSAAGSRQFQTDPIIARYAQHIAMTVLADFILLGHEQVGSYNLGASKTDMFATAVQARCDAVADTASAHAAPRIMGLNGWDKRRTPRMVPGRVAKPDVATLGAFLMALAGSGAQLWSGDPAQDKLRRAVMNLVGLPADPPVEVLGVRPGDGGDEAPAPAGAKPDDATVSADTGGAALDVQTKPDTPEAKTAA